eukprot:scaffold48104_cov38-Tisochrysis_lutea.AAC.1
MDVWMLRFDRWRFAVLHHVRWEEEEGSCVRVNLPKVQSLWRQNKSAFTTCYLLPARVLRSSVVRRR